MSLTTIQYGSVASSEVMNYNFSYLDDRITALSSSITASLASFTSSISTVNSRITEVSETLSSAIATQSAKLEEYKTKTKLLIKKNSAVPNWGAYRTIILNPQENYTAQLNGYVLLVPSSGCAGNISVNQNTVVIFSGAEANTSTELITVPVKENDVVAVTVLVERAYFIPAAELNVENF